MRPQAAGEAKDADQLIAERRSNCLSYNWQLFLSGWKTPDPFQSQWDMNQLVETTERITEILMKFQGFSDLKINMKQLSLNIKS